MMFVQVINIDTGKTVLVNLANVEQIRPRNDNGPGSVFVMVSGETIVTQVPMDSQALRLADNDLLLV